MPLHPVETTRRIRETYVRYLKTIKPFQDERLRKEFARALEDENMLVKGPYIEIMPPFEAGKSIKDLVAEGVLSPRFERLCRATEDEGLSYTRLLYYHQESAVRKVCAGRNVVVSTGTGSGKTEAFLIPILNALLQEEEGALDRPGVRALLLYPMNALANDQMERLRHYLRDYQGITFGRYVGETKHTFKEAYDHYREIHPDESDPFYEPLPNELISREQMQDRPPHILLTNYAMLEYLLLRPQDSPLFDGETGKYWRFIVLDEAHAYDGAQGTEIGLLLRRLQDRVTRGGQKRLQAVATSATLGDKSLQSLQQIAAFASKLFNLPFEWIADDPARQDVILGKRLPESGLEEPWGSGTPELYKALAEVAESWREKKTLTLPSILPALPNEVLAHAQRYAHENPKSSAPHFLYFILRGDKNLHCLRAKLGHGPQSLQEAARHLFPNLPLEQAQDTLASLVSAAILARESPQKAPLLPARYHVFARALEGAFVCLNLTAPEHQQNGKPMLFLTRQKFCPHCGSRVFELANCTQCGTSYLIGDEKPGNEIAREEDNENIQLDDQSNYLVQNSALYHSEIEACNVHYYVLENTLAQANEDALVEGEAKDEEPISPELHSMELCPRCGALYDGHGPQPDRCRCGVQTVRLWKVQMKHKRTLERCTCCSTYTKSGAVFRFLTGQDAPVSVLAGALYHQLPPGEKAGQPGQGRKMLVFTDNRQRAAFFAPYFQRAQSRQMRRALMVNSLRCYPTRDEPLRFPDWLPRLVEVTRDAGVFAETDSLTSKRRTAAAWLMQEFSGLDKRLSLEGVGLLFFRPYCPKGWHPPQELLAPPWDLTSREAFDLLSLLLNTLRRQGAVTYLLADDGIDLLTEKRDEFLPRAHPFYVREQVADVNKHIYSWVPSENYNNARLDLLVRLLAKLKYPEDMRRDRSRTLLKQLWRHLTAPANSNNWLKHETLNREGTVYRLRHDMWEVIPTLGSLDGWYICSRCQNLSPFNVQYICPIYGCTGELKPLLAQEHKIEDNLYRYQYSKEKPLPMQAAEHTAQWKPDKAAEVQKQFIDGKVNVLSCSTTFELGVDVGDLNAVVLRNVPPSTANYVQRAGRAGRRTEGMALVLTFAQRRPHDLTFYKQPERMISGQIRPPVVTLNNDKIIRRHLHSVAFAAFLRWAVKLGKEYRNTGDFFAPSGSEQSGPEYLRAFLAARPLDLEQALKRIVPDDQQLREALRLDNWGWVPKLIDGEEAVLDKAAANVCSELDEFRQLEEKASAERDYKKANAFKEIQSTIRSRDLLGYLGATNVLPKYGFPTDVVRLETDHLNVAGAKDIDLDRDLRMAISEFAPGSQVVAAGCIWYSRAIRRLPDRLWPPYGYAVCELCRRMNIRSGEEIPHQCVCGEPLSRAKHKGVFITPEYGFIADSQTDKPGEQPPEQIYASRVHFAYYTPTADPLSHPSQVDLWPDPAFSSGVMVSKAYSRYAWLALVNEGYGQGFRVCTACGFAEVISRGGAIRGKNATKHQNPLTGQSCTAELKPYRLGHRFMTDVLELQLGMPIAGENRILSVLYALLGGASDALDIPREDIDGVFFYRKGEPSFILFDTTPGGSGHVKLVHDSLRQVFEAAYRRVDTCEECGPETSCYSCLRSYRNQFVHDKLERRLAKEVLGAC